MDWINGMRCAIEYMEEHMTEEISMMRWQNRHVYQYFIFKECLAFCVESRLEYIRNRRLTMAGEELKLQRTAKVIDVA